MDNASAAAAFRYPGIDPRVWVSMGVVAADAPDARSVIFNDEDGNPLPFPVVSIVLQPKGTPIACRVSSGCAGAGEGEWSPFLAGDEVCVLIPHGDEKGGGIIVGRTNNAADPWPGMVAGADVTQNTVAFKRLRTPYIIEAAQGYLVRNATTGAQLGIDQQGQVIMNDGDGTRLFLGADAAAITSSSGDATIQIINGTDVVTASAGDGTGWSMGVDASLGLDGFTLVTPGSINMGSAGLPGSGHAVTLEQLFCILGNVICAMGAAGAFNSLNPLWAPGGITPVSLTAVFAAAIAGTIAPVPIATAGAPGGILDALGLPALIAAALAAQAPDPAALGISAPVTPGLGRGGFLL